MRIFTFALATVFVLSGIASASNHHLKKGHQSPSHKTAKHGGSRSAAHHSKVPAHHSTKSSGKHAGKAVTRKGLKNSSGSYTVRNGDHDWAISHKLGISVSQLHNLNPGVNWRRLQIGQSIRVPSGRMAEASLWKPEKVRAGGNYAVKGGDNDWIIARRVGTTPSKLRSLNPGVKWTSLQIGQKLRTPGSGANDGGWAVAGYSRIATRHAIVARDNVTIRRAPSTKAESVTIVPQGTYVTVLDRDSGWYKLRFPKGTVGWVRGDMLKPLAPKYVARATSRRARAGSCRHRRTPCRCPWQQGS